MPLSRQASEIVGKSEGFTWGRLSAQLPCPHCRVRQTPVRRYLPCASFQASACSRPPEPRTITSWLALPVVPGDIRSVAPGDIYRCRFSAHAIECVQDVDDNTRKPLVLQRVDARLDLPKALCGIAREGLLQKDRPGVHARVHPDDRDAQLGIRGPEALLDGVRPRVLWQETRMQV